MIFIFIYFLWKLPTGKNIPIVGKYLNAKNSYKLLIFSCHNSDHSFHAFITMRFKLWYEVINFFVNELLIYFQISIQFNRYYDDKPEDC